MTISDASRLLFSFFSQKGNDSFILKNDFLKVVTISENEELDKAILIEALKKFEEQGIVTLIKHLNPNNTPFAWVLNKPLEEYSQTVELSYVTISAITDLLNNICDELKIEKDRPNPLQIQEQDIQSLILVIQNLREAKSENGENELD